MTRYLLDTNVASEPTKPRPNLGVEQWIDAHKTDCHLSVMTLGEIAAGIEGLWPRNATRAGALELWLGVIRTDFADRVVDVGAGVAIRWGQWKARGAIPLTDGLIAATALEHGFTVVTRNTADFERFGVTVHNPFD